MTIDDPIERWIKAFKVPFLTYTEPDKDIPELLTDTARAERFAQANSPNGEALATDAELYLYLFTKHRSADRNDKDDQLLAHVAWRLHDRYPAFFPDPGPGLSHYRQLAPELARRLDITAAYLQAEEDKYFDSQLRDHAVACFREYGVYLDSSFLVNPEDLQRGDRND